MWHRSCSFSTKLLEQQFNQQSKLSAPGYDMILLFTPRILENTTVGIISCCATLHHWIGKKNPDMEIMSFRFRPDEKTDNAIRELGLYKGIEIQRFLRVMKNPQWEMTVLGQPQSFEEGKSFEKIKGKRIKDYFSMEDMIRFANNWGCPFTQHEFWQSDEPMYCFGSLEDDEQLADWTEYLNSVLVQ